MKYMLCVCACICNKLGMCTSMQHVVAPSHHA